MARPLHLAWALLLGACFTGGFLSGQPCTGDADCGPKLRCEAGVCGGPSGQATTATTTTTTGGSTSSTTAAPTTTAPDPTTGSTGPDPTTGDDTTTGGGCGLGRCKDLDILFVADNSPSMLIKTFVLLDFIQTFGNVMIPEARQACSVHIGVTTTDVFANNPPDCQKIGALVQADNDGDPCMYIEGLPYATLPDLDQPLSLQCMFNTGAEGSDDEAPIDALFSTVGQLDPTLNPGCNQGFYRPGAFLTVMLVTDEDDDDDDDQGNSGSQEIIEQAWPGMLSNLKPTGFNDLYLVGLFGNTDNDPACMWDPADGADGFGFEPAPKLRKFIQNAPTDRHALGTMCGVVPNADAFLPLMEEIRAEMRAACGAD